MHIFYTPDIATDRYTLNEEESRHCSKVLRLGIGSKIHLIDGKGGFYEAEIVELGKRNVFLDILSKQSDFKKRNHYLHIAVAPTKNIDRLEWFLEKATEIGIDEITPIICERSERKIVKEDRLEKVITSAVKQSISAYHPKLNAAVSFKEFISSQKENSAMRLIAHCEEDEKSFLNELIQKYQSYLILIGPEGDFTSSEIKLALEESYKPVTLGNTRLRTETAALAACFEINYINR